MTPAEQRRRGFNAPAPTLEGPNFETFGLMRYWGRYTDFQDAQNPPRTNFLVLLLGIPSLVVDVATLPVTVPVDLARRVMR